MRGIFILFFLVATVSTAQKKLCGEITYEQTTNISRPMSRDFKLKFDNFQALYEEVAPTKQKEKRKIETSNHGDQLNRVVARNNTTQEFFYNNRKDFYFMQVFFDEELYVKEDDFDWKWQLEDEVKQLGNYSCQKATTHFRGREYTAWFTQEIPLSFGPWKFYGLSGLILEVYDADGIFHIQARKISIGEDSCEIQIDTERLKNLSMDIDSYLDRRDVLIDEDFARLSSKLPKGSAPLKRDKNCKDCSGKRIEDFERK